MSARQLERVASTALDDGDINPPERMTESSFDMIGRVAEQTSSPASDGRSAQLGRRRTPKR